MTRSHCQHALAAVIACLAVSLYPPSACHGALTEEWSTTVNLYGSGELDGSPELELVVGNAAEILIIDGASGATEYIFDSSWSPGATPIVRFFDTDVDGRDEVVIVTAGSPRIGLIDFDGSMFKELWARPGLLPPRVVATNLTGSAERELIIDPAALHVLDSTTGLTIYDSDQSVGSPVIDFDVDDWDGDGIDDILASFQNTPNLVLISDPSPVAVADPTPHDGAHLSVVPNPSSADARVRFAVSTSGDVRVRIYDVASRHVRTLFDGPLPKGMHERAWDGKDRSRRLVASGVYHYEVETPGQRSVRRILRLR